MTKNNSERSACGACLVSFLSDLANLPCKQTKEMPMNLNYDLGKITETTEFLNVGCLKLILRLTSHLKFKTYEGGRKKINKIFKQL